MRLVPSPDPKLFEKGEDLRLPSGALWSIHLLSLRFIPKYHLIYNLLCAEGLVTSTDEAWLERLRGPLITQATTRRQSPQPPSGSLTTAQAQAWSNGNGEGKREVPALTTNSIILDSVVDPFVIDLSHLGATVLVLNGEEVSQFQARNVTVPYKYGVGYGSPYTGTFPPSYYSFVLK